MATATSCMTSANVSGFAEQQDIFKKAWRSLKDTDNPEQNPIDAMMMEEKQ